MNLELKYKSHTNDIDYDSYGERCYCPVKNTFWSHVHVLIGSNSEVRDLRPEIKHYIQVK